MMCLSPTNASTYSLDTILYTTQVFLMSAFLCSSDQISLNSHTFDQWNKPIQRNRKEWTIVKEKKNIAVNENVMNCTNIVVSSPLISRKSTKLNLGRRTLSSFRTFIFIKLSGKMNMGYIWCDNDDDSGLEQVVKWQLNKTIAKTFIRIYGQLLCKTPSDRRSRPGYAYAYYVCSPIWSQLFL